MIFDTLLAMAVVVASVIYLGLMLFRGAPGKADPMETPCSAAKCPGCSLAGSCHPRADRPPSKQTGPVSPGR